MQWHFAEKRRMVSCEEGACVQSCCQEASCIVWICSRIAWLAGQCQVALCPLVAPLVLLTTFIIMPPSCAAARMHDHNVADIYTIEASIGPMCLEG